MAITAQRIYSEQWNPTEEDIKSLFPMADLIAELGRDPGIKVLRDDEIRLQYPGQYNISVQARAYNLRLTQLLQEYFTNYCNSPELAGLLGVQIPQIMWVDTLGFEDPLISLHISKLNKQEIFINDIVLVKNNDFDLLSDGLIEKVLDNLRAFARNQGVKYISGYAANRSTLNLLKSKGFLEDTRESMGNDYLWRLAVIRGEQLPFYEEL
ncbi:hypothetical protein [Desulfosporosinus sp.]|uniref:hypothetical protein n=1 Tax=Desulfosporosinus sp. TaxID=157907 RepID=UPI000E9FCA8C|nr:hypothetical protein [Desulfosporosinus sp.]MBC2724909.1 hypothetical protein [Desulfosporosinus sp.]HBV87846.1 hypothetical protein [Desulfosporosinus sp.]